MKETKKRTLPQLLIHTAESNVIQGKFEFLTESFHSSSLKCGLWTSTIQTAGEATANYRKFQVYFSPPQSESAQRFFVSGLLGLEWWVYNRLLNDIGAAGPKSRLIAVRLCCPG